MNIQHTKLETLALVEMIKEDFLQNLKEELGLNQVPAALFITESSQLNDRLSGIENPVRFIASDYKYEIVQSLAKVKRYLLNDETSKVDGIVCRMNAIRRDEKQDNTHSILVDQFDWEKKIDKSEVNMLTLIEYAKKIYSVLRKIAEKTNINLPEELEIISSYDLYKKYPHLNSEQREKEYAKEKKAFFVTEIGWPVDGIGQPHSIRSYEYDDWKLNGDLIVYHEAIDDALEISSMGIRVDKHSLNAQKRHVTGNLSYNTKYELDIINDKLPQTIGGGIGQSRIAMFLLGLPDIKMTQVNF